MRELGFFIFLGVLFSAMAVAGQSCEQRSSCKDAPLAGGCTHSDQRYTVVNGKDMCLCARDGGAK